MCGLRKIGKIDSQVNCGIIIPKLFHQLHRYEVDTARYEEIVGVRNHCHGISLKDIKRNPSYHKDGEMELCDVKILDIEILKIICDEKLSYVILSKSQHIKVGMRVYMMSNPRSCKFLFANGVISYPNRISGNVTQVEEFDPTEYKIKTQRLGQEFIFEAW